MGNLTRNLACAFSLLLALLLVAAGSLSLGRFRSESRQGALRQQSILVSALAAQLDARVAALQDALAVLAASLAPEPLADPPRLQALLAASGDARRNFPCALFVLRPDGRLLAGLPEGCALLAREHAFQDYLKLPLATGRPFVSAAVSLPSQPNGPSVIFSVPVRDRTGAVRAVLCGSSELMGSNLAGGLARVRLGPGGYLSLHDARGTVLVHPDRSRLLRQEPAAAATSSGTGNSRLASTGDMVDPNGIAMLASSHRLATVDWVLTAQVPRSQVAAEFNRGSHYFWGMLALTWALSLPLIWCAVGRLTATRHLPFSAAPARDATGEAVAVMETVPAMEMVPVMETVQDPGSRKQLEEQLRTLSRAVEQSPSIVVVTDIAGTIEYVNRKFVEVTGYSKAEALGANPRLLKSGITPDEVYQDLWRTIRAGEEWRGEFQNKKKGGELYWEMALIAPVLDESGVVSHFVALKEDVTEQRALASALRHAQKMESLGTLTGGVAHDFNNILTAVIGYANLIQMKSDVPEICSKFAGQIVASAEKAAVLTRGLLAYSRKQTINLAPVDLNEIVGRIEKLLNRVLGEGIALSVLLHPEPLRIFGDSGLLEQMFMNLSVNAKEAMDGTGSLRITTSELAIDEEFMKRTGFGVPGRYARLSVSDSGPGLDQATRERIFEPFFTTRGVGGGPGLGLSIVHGIVAQHKGYIEVESEPGQGTVFRVYLPMLVPAAKAAPVPRRNGGGGETVLLVEDNAEVRAIIGEVLRGAGYRVLEAADSEEGERQFALHHEQVRLLLVDVVMPGRSGIELYRAIAALDPKLRVLFMSGYPEERFRAQGVPSELAFISKPLAPAELLTRVREILEA